MWNPENQEEKDLLEGIGDNELENEIGLSNFRERKKANIRFKRLTSFFSLIAIILLFLGVWFYSKYYYYDLLTTNTENLNTTDNTFKEIYETGEEYIEKYILDYLPRTQKTKIKTSSNQTLDWPEKLTPKTNTWHRSEDLYAQKNTKTILSYIEDTTASDSYIQKRSAVNNHLKEGISRIKDNSSNISKIKSNIFKYAFIPEELDTLLLDNKIKRSLLAIESVKFFTVLKVYNSYTQIDQGKFNDLIDYIQSQSQTNLTTSEIKDQLNLFISRWDKDIKRYLKTCYLNPLTTKSTSKGSGVSSAQNSEICNFVGTSINDFNQYYGYNFDDFNTNIFVSTIEKLLKELESEFPPPPITITLNNLNPFKGEIGFSVEINTDINKWTEEEHRNIITTFINSIRESHSIIGKSIRLDNIQVNKKNWQSADNERETYNSNYNFTIPIQSEYEKEIYDYQG